jgi:hypothetical protein
MKIRKRRQVKPAKPEAPKIVRFGVINNGIGRYIYSVDKDNNTVGDYVAICSPIGKGEEWAKKIIDVLNKSLK